MSLWTKLNDVTIQMKNSRTFARLSVNSMSFFYLPPNKTAELIVSLNIYI